MEQQRRKRIQCEECKTDFGEDEIRLLQKIVTKKSTAAIQYYFNCPNCGKSYICYYKDARVNTAFNQGNAEEARKRMKWLKRYFNDSSL